MSKEDIVEGLTGAARKRMEVELSRPWYRWGIAPYEDHWGIPMNLADIREILAIEPATLKEFDTAFQTSLKETGKELDLNPVMMTLFQYWSYAIQEKKQPGYLSARKQAEILRNEHPEQVQTHQLDPITKEFVPGLTLAELHGQGQDR